MAGQHRVCLSFVIFGFNSLQVIVFSMRDSLIFHRTEKTKAASQPASQSLYPNDEVAISARQFATDSHAMHPFEDETGSETEGQRIRYSFQGDQG